MNRSDHRRKSCTGKGVYGQVSTRSHREESPSGDISKKAGRQARSEKRQDGEEMGGGNVITGRHTASPARWKSSRSAGAKAPTPAGSGERLVKPTRHGNTFIGKDFAFIRRRGGSFYRRTLPCRFSKASRRLLSFKWCERGTAAQLAGWWRKPALAVFDNHFVLPAFAAHFLRKGANYEIFSAYV